MKQGGDTVLRLWLNDEYFHFRSIGKTKVNTGCALYQLPLH
jgi:hypothetical protein